MRLLAATALLAASGCTFTLDWSVDNLPCGSGDECLDNYSCLGRECIPDGSVTEGDTCNISQQCAGKDMVCSPVGQRGVRFTCRKRCTAYYEFTNDCSSGEFCAPFPDEDDPRDFDGACIPNQCDRNTDCESGEVCVPIHSSAAACLPGCAINWNGTEYRDNCGGTLADPKVCQPIGDASEGKRLVCLDTTSTAQTENSTCHPITNPCRARTTASPVTGMSCIGTGGGLNGVCRRHCNQLSGGAAPQCTAAQICQSFVTGDDYGICQ